VKRAFLLAAVFTAPLYLRQRQVEREQAKWRRVLLEELGRSTRRQHDELEKVVHLWNRWGEELVKQLSRAESR
jgi:hypothetical protein